MEPARWEVVEREHIAEIEATLTIDDLIVSNSTNAIVPSFTNQSFLGLKVLYWIIAGPLLGIGLLAAALFIMKACKATSSSRHSKSSTPQTSITNVINATATMAQPTAPTYPNLLEEVESNLKPIHSKTAPPSKSIFSSLTAPLKSKKVEKTSIVNPPTYIQSITPARPERTYDEMMAALNDELN